MMKASAKLLSQVCLAGLICGFASQPAFAKSQDDDQTKNNAQQAETSSGTADQDDASPANTIVVTGVRASLESAQSRKRNASEIVDSIVAEDIGKLPDQNTTDALQRVTGVQIERDYGEGSTVLVRGLQQVETTLNGREIFTAQGARGLNLQDIPSDLVSAIDVYKTSAANQIEGGLGGLIDLRTRKPFDFKGLVVSATAKGLYSDLIKDMTPNISGLVSDRWHTGIGDIGALVSVSYQRRKFRSDLISTGTPTPTTNVIPGQTVIAPNGAYDVTPIGDRRRLGIDGELQWQAAPSLEVYLEGHYAKFDNYNDNYGASVALGGLTADPGAQVENGDVVKVTYHDAPVTVLSYARDTHDKMYQIAGGAHWSSGRLHLNPDFSYTKATGTVAFNSAFTAATIPTFTQDLTQFVPASDTHGYDLLSQANTTYSFLLYSGSINDADEFAGKVDGSYDIDNGFLNAIRFGVRYANRTAASQQPTFFLSSGAPVTSAPQFVGPNPAFDFFSQVAPSVPLLGKYLVVPAPILRDHLTELQQGLGFAPTDPTPGPLTFYNVSEKTSTIYGMLDFGRSDTLVQGNVGLRFIHTKEAVSGNQTLPTGGTGPINVNSNYNNLLPSLNVKFNITDQVKLRLAASKTLTRPDFSSLSPTLTLNSVQENGAAGNPYLQPLKSDNLDASLEYYFSRTGSIYAAAFYKKVKNFISTTPYLETYGGQEYTITRPTNNQDGTIKGLEVGYQQFYDFLPGFLSGLGAQANFTLVDSSTTSSIIGQTTPLQGLSKYTYNLVGMYEKYGFSARVAYNWRSDYFDSSYPIGGTIQPSYRRGYGWLVASVSYDVSPNLSIMLEGNNLTRALRRSYYNNLDTRPHETQIDDRQILFGVRLKFGS
ncbi:MAG: TonB-dependent receptor [Sphingomonadaceae bacterium]